MRLFRWRRASSPAPNAWRNGDSVSVDIRYLTTEHVAELSRRFVSLEFVLSSRMARDTTRMSLRLADSYVKQEWYDKLGEAYRAVTGQPLVFEASVGAPSTKTTGARRRISFGTSRGDADFWFWAWLAAIFWPSHDNN